VIQSAIFTKLQSRLDEIADNLAQELDPVVEEAANMVAERAKETTPQANDRGRLKDSIRSIQFDTCKYNVVADAKADQAKTALYYGIFLEYGTEARGRGGGGIAPTFFMGRATESVKDEFEQMVNEKLRDL
jgi:HK97 gp10 family phage protein